MARPLASESRQLSCATLQQGKSFLDDGFNSIMNSETASMDDKLAAAS